MTSVSIHGPTGVLLVDGKKVFPIGLSDPPPFDAQAPSGQHAFQELANAGATMIRTGTPDWALVRINHQIAAEKAIQDAAAAHGLHCWMRLGPVANLPVKLTAGGFRDWFSAHDAHVYRFTPA
jgi:hypothetical protein